MKLIAQSENIEKFSENNYIYIDKTEYIYNLTKNYERVFFSRPRRFFEKGVDPYFKGTWIYDKWDQDKYPVLHLSFLKFSVTDLDEFKSDFCNEILKFAKANNITDYNDNKEPKILLGNVFSAIPDGRQLVLLIDEYDVPLQKAAMSGYYGQMSKVIGLPVEEVDLIDLYGDHFSLIMLVDEVIVELVEVLEVVELHLLLIFPAPFLNILHEMRDG